ncbi:hypothetical protein EVJ58_g1639 [Rhodofomes roseus]|uniref:F-box domain-containing protein n=1 Tax=Rhodofomes roseus TaxID=34475 RepID=A0A4Y9YYS9_9APHY|nr:hypothetical protein EVJ58_g1639 [Rhodofomes roseus]
MTPSHSLDSIPQEVLEHIAYFTATVSFLGPPSALVPLLSTNRRIYAALALDRNPHIWARIFAYKFDLAAAVRRLGPARTTPLAIAEEFKKRCMVLRRVRAKTDTLAPIWELSSGHARHLSELLWTAYLMMLENDGRNERQLREYARMDNWLQTYLLDENGASLVRSTAKRDQWPVGNDERVSLAMWLFWMLLRPEEYMMDEAAFQSANCVLKLFALGAHHYSLCTPSWIDFHPPLNPKAGSLLTHFGMPLRLAHPAPASPAILAYLTLVNQLSVAWDTISYMKPPDPTLPAVVGACSTEWEAEWSRALAGVATPGAQERVFVPGSLDGYWEGLLWKLREHHLYYSADEDEDDSAGADPLVPGSPLLAYMPMGAQVQEGPNGLEVRAPGCTPVVYETWSRVPEKQRGKRRLRDVILTGEGHSAWGQFSLLGRVRPCDGHLCLSKDYVDGDRGRWLYRAYLIGNEHGNLSGRWRDTLSPPEVLGYEGCFMMSRRR